MLMIHRQRRTSKCLSRVSLTPRSLVACTNRHQRRNCVFDDETFGATKPTTNRDGPRSLSTARYVGVKPTLAIDAIYCLATLLSITEAVKFEEKHLYEE